MFDGNDVMVVQFRRETSTEMDVKTVNIVVKNKSTTIFQGLYSDRPYKWRHVQNFAVKPLACGSWFQLIFEHFDVISTVDKNTEHGKLLSIC